MELVERWVIKWVGIDHSMGRQGEKKDCAMSLHPALVQGDRQAAERMARYEFARIPDVSKPRLVFEGRRQEEIEAHPL